MAHCSRLLLASLLPVAAAAQVLAPARSAPDLSGLSRDLQALSERVKLVKAASRPIRQNRDQSVNPFGD